MKGLETWEVANGRELLRAVSMSHPYIDDPKYWLERAEELRSISKLLDDAEAKRHSMSWLYMTSIQEAMGLRNFWQL